MSDIVRFLCTSVIHFGLECLQHNKVKVVIMAFGPRPDVYSNHVVNNQVKVLVSHLTVEHNPKTYCP